MSIEQLLSDNIEAVKELQEYMSKIKSALDLLQTDYEELSKQIPTKTVSELLKKQEK